MKEMYTLFCNTLALLHTPHFLGDFWFCCYFEKLQQCLFAYFVIWVAILLTSEAYEHVWCNKSSSSWKLLDKRRWSQTGSIPGPSFVKMTLTWSPWAPPSNTTWSVSSGSSVYWSSRSEAKRFKCKSCIARQERCLLRKTNIPHRTCRFAVMINLCNHMAAKNSR